jgi:hypothetical protein
MSIVLSLYPTKFGYSLGGYSHRERWARNMKEDSGSIITPIEREFFIDQS